MNTRKRNVSNDRLTNRTNQTEPTKPQTKMEGTPEDLRGFNPLFYVSQGIGGLIVILVSYWSIYHRGGFAWRSDPAHEFNWHPLLMTIGMIYLGGNANMIYRSVRNYSKKQLKLVHASTHGATLILVFFGLVAAFDSHNFAVPPRPNLYTLHSWIGIITVALYASQWVVGMISFMYPGVAAQLRTFLMPYHVFFGLSIFVMSAGAVLTGLLEKAIFAVPDYASKGGEGLLMNFIGLLVIIFTFLVVYIVQKPSYKRFPRPEDGVLLTGSLD